jgi:hypothetical protein
MEIAITLAGSGFMSGLTALFAYYQTKNIKQAETKINIGGEQMKQLLKESDDHIKYIHKLNVISNEYMLAYKEYNNIKPEKDTIIYRYILLDEVIDYDKYSDFNKEIDKTSVENLLSKLQIKGELYQEIENNYDENTLFFAYSICSLLSWLQIKKKNNNNLHASVTPKNEGLQKSLDNFIDVLNKDKTLSIPIHSQINLGESLIRESKSEEGEVKYDIIEYYEFKDKIQNGLLLSSENLQNISTEINLLEKNISYVEKNIKEIQIKNGILKEEIKQEGDTPARRFDVMDIDKERQKLKENKEKIKDELTEKHHSFLKKNIINFKEYKRGNKIIKTFGIVKMSKEYQQFEKENLGFINNLNKNIIQPFNKMYINAKNIKFFFNSIEEKKQENIQEWMKILLSLLYITLFRYFSSDQKKVIPYKEEMRKNWKLFIKELHKNNLFKSFDGKINLCDTNTRLDLLIIKWETFFKDELLKKKLDINEIKNTFYINNSEAKYLKRYIQDNAVKNLKNDENDTYKFIDKVNSNNINNSDKEKYFQGINIKNIIFQSKIEKLKKNILSDFEKYFIYTFKDIIYDFILIYDDYKLLDNLYTICNDISEYSEKRILSDTKKRESLLGS